MVLEQELSLHLIHKQEVNKVNVCVDPYGAEVTGSSEPSSEPHWGNQTLVLWKSKSALLLSKKKFGFYRAIHFSPCPPFIPSPLLSSPITHTLPIYLGDLVFFSFLGRSIYDSLRVFPLCCLGFLGL